MVVPVSQISLLRVDKSVATCRERRAASDIISHSRGRVRVAIVGVMGSGKAHLTGLLAALIRAREPTWKVLVVDYCGVLPAGRLPHVFSTEGEFLREGVPFVTFVLTQAPFLRSIGPTVHCEDGMVGDPRIVPRPGRRTGGAVR